MTDLLAAIASLYLCLRLRWPPLIGRRANGRRCASAALEVSTLRQRKPFWVRQAVIRLKALQPDLGCRRIALTFNRLHATKDHVTVSKSWVADVIRTHHYEIKRVREQVRGRKGKPGPLNRVWGLDLTGKTDGTGKLHMILGLVDHGSRLNLSLQVLKTKSSIAMLRILLDVIERFGMPKAVRTDNEACFTSRLFRFGLRVLGIQHQTTDLHCPWMNGRVERFFGTLKERLNHWRVPDREAEWPGGRHPSAQELPQTSEAGDDSEQERGRQLELEANRSEIPTG
jgi:putative transposase